MNPIEKQIVNNLFFIEYLRVLCQNYVMSGLMREAAKTNKKISELYFTQNLLQDLNHELFGNEDFNAH
jgi:hypothetical protein